MTWIAPASGTSTSSTLTSCVFPSEMWMNVGMLPRVEQRVHLDHRLGRAKRCPGKDRQTEVDGRRVQGVGRVLQLDAKAVPEVELPGVRDQVFGESGMDAPVSRLVGIGQRRAPDLLPKPHVVKLGRLSREADLDVAQALTIGQMREGHHAELLGTRYRAASPSMPVKLGETAPWYRT